MKYCLHAGNQFIQTFAGDRSFWCPSAAPAAHYSAVGTSHYQHIAGKSDSTSVRPTSQNIVRVLHSLKIYWKNSQLLVCVPSKINTSKQVELLMFIFAFFSLCVHLWFVCVHAHPCVFMCVCVCQHVYLCTCVCVSMCFYVHMCECACMLFTG